MTPKKYSDLEECQKTNIAHTFGIALRVLGHKVTDEAIRSYLDTHDNNPRAKPNATLRYCLNQLDAMEITIGRPTLSPPINCPRPDKSACPCDDVEFCSLQKSE